MVNVAIVGAAGYTGRELLTILLRHPLVNIVTITSETNKGKPLGQVFPHLARYEPILFDGGDHASIADGIDVAFLCLPHGKSMSLAPKLREAGVTVFDLSADFRIKDVDVYEKWYQAEHRSKDLIKEAVYGLPELHKGEIAKAELVAVPGCYPTSAILALAPIIGTNLIDRSSIIVNSVSGSSGAGRKAGVEFSLAELDGNFFAYGAPTHRHTPEMEQELSQLASEDVTITFTPHLLPTERGIHTTVYASLTKELDDKKIRSIYREFYGEAPFVTIVDGFPKMKWAVNGSGCYIGMTIDQRNNRLVVMSVIDNLLKGASAQAVQCFNIRFGFDEDTAL